MASTHRAAPIGVFDSGLGGLTVARAIMDVVGSEDLVYLGDTARVPYGTRSPETVVRYARACGRHLQTHGVKLLVVACNTVSAVALDMLRVELDIPVLGVVEPGARAGVLASRTGRVGVIATAGTIASGAYARAAASADSRVELFAQAAPLLVPLVEEGWLSGDVPEKVVRHYLEPLAVNDIDTLVLGCTHYPLLGALIAEQTRHVLGHEVRIVDSAVATARELASFLRDRDLANPQTQGSLRMLVTDKPRQFTEVASRFLRRAIDDLACEQVDL